MTLRSLVVAASGGLLLVVAVLAPQVVQLPLHGRVLLRTGHVGELDLGRRVGRTEDQGEVVIVRAACTLEGLPHVICYPNRRDSKQVGVAPYWVLGAGASGAYWRISMGR